MTVRHNVHIASRLSTVTFMSGTANPTHEVHRGDIPYQPPFERSASPNDSLTTAYGPDETNQSDAELPEDAFSNKVLAGLRVSEKREEEERAETRPLIMPRARRGTTSAVNPQTEEKGGALFNHRMRQQR